MESVCAPVVDINKHIKDKKIGKKLEQIKENEAKSCTTILEIVGDIPYVDAKLPENVLFVCKLNCQTTSDKLRLIFSKFGRIISSQVIKNKKTGQSLKYAFIEFEKKEACEEAFLKMNDTKIHGNRIRVDFCHSLPKLKKSPVSKCDKYQNFNKYDCLKKSPEHKKQKISKSGIDSSKASNNDYFKYKKFEKKISSCDNNFKNFKEHRNTKRHSDYSRTNTKVLLSIKKQTTSSRKHVLFVFNLNPVTSSIAIEKIFLKFGPIVKCTVIKDKSGHSKRYAFIEFARKEDCNYACSKMDNVLIDDFRIGVQFSKPRNFYSKINNNSGRQLHKN